MKIILFLILAVASAWHIPSLSNITKDIAKKVASEFPVRQTTNGAVRGFVLDEVQMFMGIPFAEPPTGELRFRPPVPLTHSWSDTRDMFVLGNMCPQMRLFSVIELGSEDCLYLNVFVPDGHSLSDKLPVMVWIFGGGFTIGDGYEFGWYDPRNLVNKHQAIIVSFNYRVGALGFLALPELLAEDGTSGANGLLDQRLALEWVQKNIANFNGDPGQVTIFGESAGGFSVCYHYAHPLSQGLFNAAIMESGSCDSFQLFMEWKDAISFGYEFTAKVGCDASKMTKEDFVRCVRAVPSHDMVVSMAEMLNPNFINSFKSTNLPIEILDWVPPLAPLFSFGPAIDGSKVGLTDLPLNMMKNAPFPLAPLLLGSNNNEGVIFVPTMPLVNTDTHYPLNEADLRKVFLGFFNASVVDYLREVLYPADLYTPDDCATHTLTDLVFSCGARRAIRTATRKGAKTYLYHFDYDLDWVEKKLGDYHMSEMYFVWDSEWPSIVHKFSDNDHIVADVFGTYWATFAKKHDPNTADLPHWPRYDAGSDQNIIINTNPSVESEYRSKQCDFWDTVTPTDI